MMRATGVRMLVIDEVHNLLCGSRDQQRRFLNLLRWLGNELQDTVWSRSARPRGCARYRATTNSPTASHRSGCLPGKAG